MKKATMKAVQDRIEARLFREAKEAVKALEDFKQNGRDLTLLLNKGIAGEALKVRQELLNNAAPLNAPTGYRPVQMLVEYPMVASQG